MFTSWSDFTDYGVKVHKAQACPYKLRTRLVLDVEAADYMEKFFGIPIDEDSMLVPSEAWVEFAKWILIAVEKCKYIGVTADGKVTGSAEPEQVEEYIDCTWEGPFTFYPAH